MRENHINGNTGLFPDFYEFNLYMIQNDSKMFVFSLLIAFSAKCFIKKLAMSLHIDLFGITLHYSEIRNSESKSCEAVQSHSNDNPDSFILN